MQSFALKYLFQIAIVAIVYFVTGRLGLLLAIPPGFSTAIWPASGVAVAALLMGGTRLWPGVWFGHFAVNVFVTGGFSVVDASISTLLLPGLIAMGGALQAYVSASLINSAIGYPNALDDRADILKFAIWGGVVPCLLSASIGLVILYSYGIVAGDHLLYSWTTWYWGDTMGVIIFVPLILIIWGEPRSIWRSRIYNTAFPIIAIFCFAVLFFFYSHEKEDEIFRNEIIDQAKLLDVEFTSSLVGNISVLHSLRDFYDSSSYVDRNEFRTFVKSSLAKFPSLLSLYWNPYVLGEELSDFEKNTTKEGYTNYRVVEKGADGKIKPVAIREFHVPVLYIEPNESNEKAVGFDVASNPIRYEAIIKARDTGEAIATAPIDLIQEQGRSKGFLIFCPVYKKGMLIDTIENRRSAIMGFTVGVFNVPKFLENMILPFKSNDIEFKIKTVFHGGQSGLLYETHSGNCKSNDFQFHKSVIVGQKSWDVSYYSSGDYPLAKSGWSEWLVLAGGLAFASFSGVFLLIISGETSRVMKLVDEKTDELSVSENRLRALVESAPVCIHEIDLKGRLMSMNQAGLDMMGVTNQGDICGLSYFDVPDFSEREKIKLLFHKAAKGEGSTFDFTVNIDGKVMAFGSCFYPVYGKNNRVTHLMGITEDITLRKKAESELIASKEAAETASLTKARFISNMSHEIRTPMNGVLGMADLLLMDEELTSDQRDSVEIINESGKSLMKIVNDIFDFSMIDSGELKLDLSSFYLNVLVDETIGSLRKNAEQKGLALKYIYATDQDDMVVGDSSRIQQALLKVLENAIKFTESGFVSLLINQNEKGEFVFTIEDTGIGLNEGVLKDIFKEFVQADLSSTRNYDGTGLGLAITKQLLALMGGRIKAEIRKSGGSKFTITIPLEMNKIESSKVFDSDVQTVKVLIADDDISNQKILKSLIVGLGFEADVATNGKDALALAMKNQYSHILMAVKPDMDGIESAQAIRGQDDQAKASVRMIALTADNSEDFKEKCIRAGMNELVQKPVSLAILKEILER